MPTYQLHALSVVFIAAGLLSCDNSSPTSTAATTATQAKEPAAAALSDPIPVPAPPPTDAPMEDHARAFLHRAIAELQASDLSDLRRTWQHVDLILDFARLGALDDADEHIQALDAPTHEMLVDALYVQLTRRDDRLKTPWALAQIDAIENDARQVTRLLTLAGGIGPAEVDIYNPAHLASRHASPDANAFALQALELIEARGGLDTLPEDATTLRSPWVRSNHGEVGGRAQAGIDHYPGRAAIYQSLARAHANQGNLDRATAYIEDLEDSPDLAVRTLQEIAAYQYASGEAEAAFATLRRAANLADEAVPQRAGGITHQQYLYGDQDAARAGYARTARAMVAQPVEDDRDLVHLFNALSTTCQTLREMDAEAEVAAVIEAANERVASLPDDHPARYTWPMRQASVALLAGDPASAADFVALMPAQPRRVEMGHSVVVGWLHKGDAEGARAALDHLLAEAEAIPRGGAGWYYNTAVIREEFEPWVTRLEQGEDLPIRYNADERYRQVMTLCESGRVEDALVFLDEHSHIEASKLKHLIAIAQWLHESGDTERLRRVLTRAHTLAVEAENLHPRQEATDRDGLPRLRFLDHGAARQQRHDPPQAQAFQRFTKLSPPVLGSGERDRIQETWAISSMADLFKLQLVWGHTDDAINILRNNSNLRLAAYAATYVLASHDEIMASRYATTRRDLADPHDAERFRAALLTESESLSIEAQTYIRLSLSAIPTDHPDVARRVTELMPDLPHEAHHERSRNLTEWDRLVYPEDHIDVATIYRHCQEAYKAGMLAHTDAMRQSLEAAITQADQLDHAASRAAMSRLIGGIALALGQDDLAASSLDRAIALYADHAHDWAPPQDNPNRPGQAQLHTDMLTRVLEDAVGWRVQLDLSDHARERAIQALAKIHRPSGPLAQAQFQVGDVDAANQTLAQALADVTPQEHNGDTYQTERRQALINIYLQAQQPGLAWDTVIATQTPWLYRELLPDIARAFAVQAPAALLERIQQIPQADIRAAVLNAAADGLITELTR